MTPKELVEDFQRSRDHMAEKMWNIRKTMRNIGHMVNREVWPISKENEWVRRVMYSPVGYGMIRSPIKPTIDNLACLAEIYTLYGRAPLPWEHDPTWVNPLDTEYYSACGYEDYLFERRESAREYAQQLIEAVDYLLLLERFPVADLPRDLTIMEEELS